MKSKTLWAAAGLAAVGFIVSQTGLAQLAGAGRAILELDKSGAPKLSSVGGDVWCRAVHDRNLATYQQYVAELISIGGDVESANKIVLPSGDGVEWFALVCGKIQQPQ